MKRSHTLRYLFLSIVPVFGVIFAAQSFGSASPDQTVVTPPAQVIDADWSHLAVLGIGLLACLLRLRPRASRRVAEAAVRPND